MNKRVSFLLSAIAMSFIMVAIYSLAYWQANSQAKVHAASEIKTRLALDHERIGLEQPFFKVAANDWHKTNYLTKLNDALLATNSPIVVTDIEMLADVSSLNKDSLMIADEASQEEILLLNRPFGTIQIKIKQVSVFPYHGLVIPIALSLLLTYYWIFYSPTFNTRHQTLLGTSQEREEKPAQLIIDLYHKTLQLGESGSKVELANKPLCFYLALLEYSVVNPSAVLNANKDLPDEFLTLANKYFLRLVEIGHTIRKRPNFTNSLEKTLSEIRAALDEVFLNDSELKTDFYPPKASGEGSRSKLHNFSLPLTGLDNVIVHGK